MSDTRLPRPPRLVWPLAAAGMLLVAGPIAALVARAPWGSLAAHLASPQARSALGLSIVSSVAAAAAALLLGLPLAWVLARRRFPGRAALRALVALPLLLPPVVGGVALVLVFGRLGPVGALLEQLAGVVLFGSPAAVVIAQTFVALPFAVLTLEAGFRSLDPRLELVAASLGASRGVVARRITLPLLAPSIGAAAVAAWARALGEFGATITFAGNLPGRTQTMPLAIYVAINRDLDDAVALSVVLVVLSAAVLALLRERWLPGAQG